MRKLNNLINVIGLYDKKTIVFFRFDYSNYSITLVDSKAFRKIRNNDYY